MTLNVVNEAAGARRAALNISPNWTFQLRSISASPHKFLNFCRLVQLGHQSHKRPPEGSFSADLLQWNLSFFFFLLTLINDLSGIKNETTTTTTVPGPSVRQRSASAITHITTCFVLMWHTDGIKGETLNSLLMGDAGNIIKQLQKTPDPTLETTNVKCTVYQNVKRGHATCSIKSFVECRHFARRKGSLVVGRRSGKGSHPHCFLLPFLFSILKRVFSSSHIYQLGKIVFVFLSKNTRSINCLTLLQV